MAWTRWPTRDCEVVQVVESIPNTMLAQNPLQGLGKGAEDGWGGGEAERELGVHKYLIIPLDSQVEPVMGVNGDDAICVLNINLGQQCSFTE